MSTGATVAIPQAAVLRHTLAVRRPRLRISLHTATLGWMASILALCVLIPRVFRSYFWPLGTLIDAFDWLIGRQLPEDHGKRLLSGARQRM